MRSAAPVSGGAISRAQASSACHLAEGPCEDAQILRTSACATSIVSVQAPQAQPHQRCALLAIVTALVAIVAGFVLYFASGRLAGTTAGRLALLCGVLFLPLVAIGAGASRAYKESSSTIFCLSCHEMEDYGRSLFVDDRTFLPAVHYQKRLVDRDHACFQCHTNYTMFGDVAAKFDGLRHVWVHYLGEQPEKFELYEPYPNANCLHCHDDARSFLEAPAHAGHFDAVLSGEESCLSCHARGHGLQLVEEGSIWLSAP